jgi:hypothetical protein
MKRTLAAVLTTAVALLVPATAAGATDTWQVDLHNTTAVVGTADKCPPTGAWWHFVTTPNGGGTIIGQLVLDLDDPQPYVGTPVPNGSQLDNVFVAVPAGHTVYDLVDGYGTGTGTTPTKLVLSHLCLPPPPPPPPTTAGVTTTGVTTTVAQPTTTVAQPTTTAATTTVPGTTTVATTVASTTTTPTTIAGPTSPTTTVAGTTTVPGSSTVPSTDPTMPPTTQPTPPTVSVPTTLPKTGSGVLTVGTGLLAACALAVGGLLIWLTKVREQ